MSTITTSTSSTSSTSTSSLDQALIDELKAANAAVLSVYEHQSNEQIIADQWDALDNIDWKGVDVEVWEQLFPIFNSPLERLYPGFTFPIEQFVEAQSIVEGYLVLCRLEHKLPDGPFKEFLRKSRNVWRDGVSPTADFVSDEGLNRSLIEIIKKDKSIQFAHLRPYVEFVYPLLDTQTLELVFQGQNIDEDILALDPFGRFLGVYVEQQQLSLNEEKNMDNSTQQNVSTISNPGKAFHAKFSDEIGKAQEDMQTQHQAIHEKFDNLPEEEAQSFAIQVFDFFQKLKDFDPELAAQVAQDFSDSAQKSSEEFEAFVKRTSSIFLAHTSLNVKALIPEFEALMVKKDRPGFWASIGAGIAAFFSWVGSIARAAWGHVATFGGWVWKQLSRFGRWIKNTAWPHVWLFGNFFVAGFVKGFTRPFSWLFQGIGWVGKQLKNFGDWAVNSTYSRFAKVAD